MKQLKFSKKYVLVSADDFSRLTNKHSSAPSIGIDPMRSLKEWRAVASNPAIEESDKAIANTQLYRRYLDEMEKTRKKPVSEQFGSYNPKHQQQVLSYPLSSQSNPPTSTTHLYDDQESGQEGEWETRRERRRGHERTGRSRQRHTAKARGYEEGGSIKTVAHPRGRSLYSQSPRGNHRSGERAYERANLTLRRSTRSKRPNQSEKWVSGPGRRR